MRRHEARLARFVDDLLHQRRPRRGAVSEADLAAMRAAVDLQAVRPGADLPSPDFVAGLSRKLRRELEAPQQPPAPSRRTLLAAAGLAGAAVVAGVVGDRIAAGLEAGAAPATGPELVPAGGSWRAVAAVADVPEGHLLRFDTGAMVGFVVHRAGAFEALSAVCTHLGCLLQSDGAGSIACPCHRTTFGLDGRTVTHQLPQAPPPLPRLRARVRDGMIEVFAV
jgi:cytochrome b6-f complex iron-sulfur subunit